jgi:hypothetical protein
VVISMTDGSHFARERLMAFTPWHLDAVSGSHPPHLVSGVKRESDFGSAKSVVDPKRTSTELVALANFIA